MTENPVFPKVVSIKEKILSNEIAFAQNLQKIWQSIWKHSNVFFIFISRVGRSTKTFILRHIIKGLFFCVVKEHMKDYENLQEQKLLR